MPLVETDTQETCMPIQGFFKQSREMVPDISALELHNTQLKQFLQQSLDMNLHETITLEQLLQSKGVNLN